MKINRSDRIAGLPILRIRDFLRGIGESSVARAYLEDTLRVSPRKAAEVLRELKRREWLAPTRERYSRGFFQVTDAGRRLALASAAPRIRRDKAKTILNEFLERCAAVNRRDELAYYVEEVRVFGSYLTKQPDLGDVDLVVILKPREVPGRDQVTYSRERADNSGRTFRTFFERLFYAEREVRLLLKARNPYISMHSEKDPALKEAKTQVVFRDARFGKVRRSGRATPMTKPKPKRPPR